MLEREGMTSGSGHRPEFLRASPMLMLVLLTAVYIVGYTDRQVFALLLPDMNKEFGLTDTQIGQLTGIAFPIVYGITSLIVAVAADRLNRVQLIALSTGFFSVMTMACGAAQGFGSMFLGRLGVGVGEAGTTPPSLSLIADNFEGPARQFANSVYATAAIFGILIAYVFMGNISVLYGWRVALYAAGAFGVLVALLLIFVVRDTARSAPQAMGIRDLKDFPALLHIPSFRWVLSAAVFHSILTESSILWLPLFLSRSLHMSQAEISWFLGLNYSILGLLGIVAGGYISTRLRSRSVGAPQLFCSAVAALTTFFYVVVYVSPNIIASQVALGLVIFLSISAFGSLLAFVQDVTPEDGHAKATAMLMLFAQLGIGLGSLIIGALSDALLPYAGHESLRYALLPVAGIAGLAACLCYLRAARHGDRDFVTIAARPTGQKEFHHNP